MPGVGYVQGRTGPTYTPSPWSAGHCGGQYASFWNDFLFCFAAIYGYSFCKAARRAFMVILNNALRVAAINSVGTFTLFLGKLACIALTVCASFYLIKVNFSVEISSSWLARLSLKACLPVQPKSPLLSAALCLSTVRVHSIWFLTTGETPPSH